MKKFKNKLIVFEGIDGVGKSTISLAIKDKLKTLGIKAVLYEEHERKIKNFNILKPFIKSVVAKTSINSSFLFYLSSAVYKSTIISKLLEKQWVICDRYIYSTIAYHNVNGASKKITSNLKNLPILKPDFAFLITTKDSIRINRIKKRKVIKKEDLIPKKYGNRVHQTEAELLKLKLRKINNNGTFEQIVTSILEEITKE